MDVGDGEMRHDFTYVEDIVEGVARFCDVPDTPDDRWDAEDPEIGQSSAPFRIYSVGNGASVDLMEFIKPLEEKLGREVERHPMPGPAGNVRETWAIVDELKEAVG